MKELKKPTENEPAEQTTQARRIRSRKTKVQGKTKGKFLLQVL